MSLSRYLTVTEDPIGRFALALLVFAVVSLAPVRADDLRLDAASGASGLLTQVDELADPTGRWTLADVLHRTSDFRPMATHVADPHVWAFAPTVQWFRFRPRIDGPAAAGPWFVETSMEVDRSRIYLVPDRGPPRASVDFGMLVPFADRTLPFLRNAVELPPGSVTEGTLYLRTVTREDAFGSLAVRPIRWEAVDGRALDGDRTMPELLVCGIVGALGLFNLVIGVRLRESIYVRYAAAMGSFACYACVESGVAWRWVWPHASLPYDITAYAGYLVYLALVLWFAATFLDLPNTQRSAWCVICFAFACVVGVDGTMALAPNLLDRTGYAGLAETSANALLLIAILGSGIVAWRHKFAGAGSYVVAFAGVVFGLLIGECSDNSLIPESLWTDAAPGIGVAWEAFFLALAVSKRIGNLRGERDTLATVAFTDPLTGIPNRRAFEHRLYDAWRRAVHERTSVSIVLIDVDFFKAFNDRNGHMAGDDALERVASTVARTLRGPNDVVARFGGEEFVVLLPNCDARGAGRVAEAVRVAIERLGLTVSAGVACETPTRESQPQDLIEIADRAMYRAKREGRNRVVVAAERVA